MPVKLTTIFRAKEPITKKQAVEVKNEETHLHQVVQDAHTVLFSMSSVFPFELFPDKVIIRINHVDIIRNIFLWSGSTRRILVSNINQVTLFENPFFSALEITAKGFPEIIVMVKFLKKSEAIRAKRLIAGLIECHEKNVDFTKYSMVELVHYIEDIGRAREGEI